MCYPNPNRTEPAKIRTEPAKIRTEPEPKFRNTQMGLKSLNPKTRLDPNRIQMGTQTPTPSELQGI